MQVTRLLSRGENVTRKNKKHKQRRNQGGQKDSNITLHMQVRWDDQSQYHHRWQVSSLAGDLPWCSCPLLRNRKGGDRAFCHSAHTHIYIYTYTHTHMYVYIYIYTYTYTHIYTYTNMFGGVRPQLPVPPAVNAKASPNVALLCFQKSAHDFWVSPPKK